MHSTGASFFFIVVYLHMFRALLYGSYRRPRELLWIFGVFVYLCLMAEAFFGYLLPWGQMSYWGAQVIVNLFGTIPVSGPDLATTNLEPHELLLFLRRRLGEIFVTDPLSLERRLGEIDEEPDPDARYRINEFFCFDNIWREAVGALLRRSDAILLDLRGFTAARRGTAFEIKLLAERDALRQSVILTDDQTDMAAVERAIAEISGAVLPQGRVLRTDGPVVGDQIFGLLVRGVEGETKMPMDAR